MSERESHLVELVTEQGEPEGTATVAVAHEWPGQLHRAFSVLLVDDRDRFLLQQRAAGKTRFAGRWGNACCGHPAPGAGVPAEADRRLVEELGLSVPGLRQVGVYRYRAGDARTGRVEHEYDHVLFGRVSAGAALRTDPAEIDDVRWVALEDLSQELREDPARYVPWLPGVLSVWQQSIAREPADEH
jgi:isopentenyl-diphosphate delta-isomerase